MLPGTELVTSESTELAPTVPEQQLPAVKSPGDFRTESIAHALDAAYARASMLTLSEKEAAELAKDFPDEAFRLGAGGDPDLIYIEHAYLRKRLNEVLGVGAAVPIRRREWSEEFRYSKQVGRDRWEPRVGIRIYVDLVLVVRGCVVGEAIGDACYYPDNAKTNYSDALESAKSNAFRRCCKEFGVGLQAWMKDWSEEWKRKNAPAANGKSSRKDERQRETKSQRDAKETEQPTFNPPTGWPNSTPDVLTAWVQGLHSGSHFTDAIKMVFAAKLPATPTHVLVKAIADQYQAVMADKSPADQTKAAKFTKWISDTLAAAAKADLDAQGKETFGGAVETFAPPKGWPDTPAVDIITWVVTLKSVAALKTALGMVTSEESLQQDLRDWEAVINAIARQYKSVTNNFNDKAARDSEVEAQLTSVLVKIEGDKAAAQDNSFSPPAEEPAAT